MNIFDRSVTLHAKEGLFVATGDTWYTIGGAAPMITAIGENAITIEGRLVFAPGASLASIFVKSGSLSTISISESGYLDSSIFGLLVDGSAAQTQITNAGVLHGDNVGILDFGQHTSIHNTGMIFGQNAGVQLVSNSTGDTKDLTNSGVIVGRVAGVFLSTSKAAWGLPCQTPMAAPPP